MKNTLYFVISLLLISCAKKEDSTIENGYNLTVKIKGVEDNKTVFLKKQANGVSIKLDSAITKNETVKFNGKIELPEIYGIFIENNSQGIFPIIESGNIQINTHIDSIYEAKATGTPLNKQLNEYKDKAREISERMNQSFYEFQKARAENNLDRINEINKKLKLINKDLSNYKLDFIKNNPNSFVSSMVLFSIAQNKETNLNTIENLYNSLSNEVKKSEFSNNIKSILDNSIRVKDSIN